MKTIVEVKEQYCKKCELIRFHQIVRTEGMTTVICWSCGTTVMKPELCRKDKEACVEYATRGMPDKKRRKITPEDIEDMEPEVRERYRICARDMENALKAYLRKPIEAYNKAPSDDLKPLEEEMLEPTEEVPETDNMPAPDMDFGDVIKAMKESKDPIRFARRGWNGKNMYIVLQRPTRTSKMTLPYIYMMTADRQLVPWLASQSDMLADDWHAVEVSE